MNDLLGFLSGNMFWIMVMAVPIVGIIAGTLQKTRANELRVHQEMRKREMEHEQKMKALELEIIKAKSKADA